LIDDIDRTWVHGVRVGLGGSSLASQLWVYELPAGSPKTGRYVITIDVG